MFLNRICSPAPQAPPASAAPPLSLREFALIVVQLALLAAVVWEFHVEERRHLLTLLGIVTGGFGVHAWLPVRLRLPWFCALSIGCLILLVGPIQAAQALAVGGGLIGISRLPIGFTARVFLLLAAAAGIVWLRRSSDAAFWPIVGSMFMFRLIVYMHALRHERVPTSAWKTLAYFFMAPNVFFTLFPVVDYRTFCDQHGVGRQRETYQAGVHWMATGVGHLLLYRLIKAFLLPTPLEIRSVPDLIQFLVMNYALYVRVSGQFHLVCGMLHLFGFNLPRTHNAYFLASSFSDIWRRINIYWRDFLAKVVFFPAFFRFRRLGDAAAVVLGVLGVFVATWLAHSWQVFWLLGEFPFRAQDAALWLSAGVVVTASALWDYRKASGARAGDRRFSLLRSMVVSLQTVGVFLCVCLFWARWTNREVFRFLLLGDARLTCTAAEAAVLAAWLLAAILAVVVIQFFIDRGRHSSRSNAKAGAWWRPAELTFERSAALHLAVVAVVVLGGVPQFYAPFGTGPASVLAALQTDTHSGVDAFRVLEGYYEQLNHGTSQASLYLGNPVPRNDRGGRYAAMTQQRRDVLETELIPGWRGEFAGSPISVNRWGMRDRDRTLAKPPGTYRIALVGSSPVMGYGVGDDETFAHLLEVRMNAGPSSFGKRVEVLNFGGGSYFPIHRRVQIERKVLQFRPDLILYFAHQDELIGSVQWLSRAVSSGIDLEDSCLDDLVRRAEITPATPDGVTYLRLNDQRIPILSCIYQRIEKVCRGASVDLLWVYLPMPGVDDPRINPGLYTKLARDAGIDAIDLSDWLTDVSADAMSLDGDHHPNAKGHRLIAERLFAVLRARLKRAGVRTSSAAGPARPD